MRMRSISIQQWIFSFLQLACAGILIIWLVYPPLPGYAISLIAIAAAAMSVHPDMKGFQKAIWMVLICGLLVVELTAIRLDRQTASAEALKESAAQEANFSEVRKGQEQDFQNITRGFTKTLAQNEREFRATQLALNKTLATSELTQNQTHPKALLHVDHTFTEIKLTGIVFHTYLLNDGNDAAAQVFYLTKGYVTDLADLGNEEKIIQEFEEDWHHKHHELREPIPSHEKIALENETEPLSMNEIRDLAAGKKALYYVTRIAYSDSIGHWLSDRCSVTIQGRGLAHTCVNLNTQRYKAPTNPH